MAEPYTYRIGKGSIFLGVLMLVSSLGAFLYLHCRISRTLKGLLPLLRPLLPVPVLAGTAVRSSSAPRCLSTFMRMALRRLLA